MITRREVVLGGALTLVSYSCVCAPCLAQGALPTFGCCVPADQAPAYFSRATGAETFVTGNEKLVATSASAMLDYALAQALATLCDVFGVLPGFSYYQEVDSYNALATKRPMLERTDGTVLFGLDMLGHLLDVEPQPDAAIVAVCAHEFGHILAMKRGLQDGLVPDAANPFRGEQFADYISGFFAGLRQREEKDFPAVAFATTMRGLGGVQRGTHGTAQERGRAVVEGFKAAKDRGLSVDDGVREGARYAETVV